MNKGEHTMENIIFEIVLGIVVITFWFTVLWYAAVYLGMILPPFEWSVLIAPAYGLKYFIYLGDILLMAYVYFVDIKVAFKRVRKYEKDNS